VNLPNIVSRDEWLKARENLLTREKAATKLMDELAAQRRALPMVTVEKKYVFEGVAGPATLLDLFDGRPQLVVHHFMFDPTWESGCRSCTFFEDDFCPQEHLHEQDISYAVVSRAPLATSEPYRRSRGWDVPWYSSYGSDFNYDFHVTMDPAVAPVAYNYRAAADHERAGMAGYNDGEQPGVSVFLRDGDRVFHTYSTFARGVEPLLPSPHVFDLTPLGRH
jgi:predicted dithiol-disulfide oxidoreductase (DUF899 family)